MDTPRSGHGGRVLALVIAVALCVPAVLLRVALGPVGPVLGLACYGAAFIGAALLLVWGTELAELEVPTGIALSALAVVAILPEYAIDLQFAYQAGNDPDRASLALANMTGANRLLIGIGWSLVVFVGALGYRRARSDRSAMAYTAGLRRLAAIDLVVLGAASLYMLQAPLRSTLTLVDTAVLLSLFVFYVVRLSKAPKEEPEFIGPPVLIARLPVAARRVVVVTLLVTAAAVIVSMAHPLSESLIGTGTLLGIDRFLMVQWIAPLATESAELVPACLFAFRLLPDKGLGTLLSSKINQWTLLVSMVPAAFALAAGGLSGLPMDPVQRQEVLLTAAQSMFALSLLIDLRLSVRQATAIITLFLGDLAASVVLAGDAAAMTVVRWAFSSLYLLLAVAGLARARGLIPGVVKDGTRTHPRDLVGKPQPTR